MGVGVYGEVARESMERGREGVGRVGEGVHGERAWECMGSGRGGI